MQSLLTWKRFSGFGLILTVAVFLLFPAPYLRAPNTSSANSISQSGLATAINPQNPQGTAKPEATSQPTPKPIAVQTSPTMLPAEPPNAKPAQPAQSIGQPLTWTTPPASILGISFPQTITTTQNTDDQPETSPSTPPSAQETIATTPEQSSTPTQQPTITPTPTPQPIPTPPQTPTPTITPQPNPQPSPSPASSPTPTATPQPTSTPNKPPTPTPTPTPINTSTLAPTNTPLPSPNPTPIPSLTPSITPSPSPQASIGTFNDQACTSAVSSISWGSLSPGASTTQVLYVRNQGNTPVTLSKAMSNWNPTTLSNYLTLIWDYTNQQLSPSATLKVTLTLTVSASITAITNFSFSTTITATS